MTCHCGGCRKCKQADAARRHCNRKRRRRVDPITKAFRRIEREIMQRKRQPRFGFEDELA